jgi:hypothetical protein
MNHKKGWQAIGAILAGLTLVVTTAIIAFPAVSQIAGLAVAQSSTMWNSVIDASKGDGQTSGILGTGLYMYDGALFNRARGDATNGLDVDVTRMPGGAFTPADGAANPTGLQGSEAFCMKFNGTTWDRCRTASADSLAGTGIGASGLMGFNGASWDRIDSVSATNNTATTSVGAAYTVPLGTWAVTANATGGTPSISRPAGGGSVRHVTSTLSACVATAGTAQPAVLVHLRDGGAGAGTIVRSWALAAPANDSNCIDLSGLNITGTANTAMTLEFAAATVAGSIGTVNISGYSIQ